MTRAPAALSLLVLALVPASAGASAGAPARPLALTAAPTRLGFSGTGRSTVRIRNPGQKRIAVDVARAGFALDLRGRPRIVGGNGARSAARWLTWHPAHFMLAPHSSRQLVVSASVPPRAAPGDHDALVLLTSRPVARGRVSVRLRLGVVVVVRAPGTVVRRLRLGPLRPARRSGNRALDLVVVNAGNVTEQLRHARVVVSSLSKNRRLAAVAAAARELRPRTRGVVEFRLPTPAHGRVTARIVIPAEPGRAVIRRTYRIRV
jgi:hypothetical protein